MIAEERLVLQTRLSGALQQFEDAVAAAVLRRRAAANHPLHRLDATRQGGETLAGANPTAPAAPRHLGPTLTGTADPSGRASARMQSPPQALTAIGSGEAASRPSVGCSRIGAIVGWRCMRVALMLVLLLSTGRASSTELSGRIVAVSDGDTVTVLDSRLHQHKIRLAGIDAPEKKQPFGHRAKAALSAMAFNRQVAVQWSKVDRYKRLVGKVLVDGEDVNRRMIALGLAWHYKKYSAEQTTVDRDAYSAAEALARSRRVGLWAESSPVAPWDFRDARRQRTIDARH